MQNVQDNYKGKLIYAFTGMGKTFTKGKSKDIVETDELLCQLMNCDLRNLYSRLAFAQKNMPEVLEYTFENLKGMINTLKKKGKTVLTGSDRLLKYADLVFLPGNLENIQQNLQDSGRKNTYKATLDFLQKRRKKVEITARNQNKTITELNGYLSEHLLK